VAKNLCASDLVTEIIVAGRNLDAAEEFAHELGSKATAAKVDALNETEIRLAAKGSDLIVNTAGPDYKVSYPAARAAIQTGIHYCDLCADCDTTERLLELDSAAKSADAIILLGMGKGPGETNLLMKHAASHLDTVEDLRLLLIYNLVGTIFYFGVEDPGKTASEMRRTGRVNASWETVMNWAGGRVCVFHDKRLEDVDPSEHQESVEFPDFGSADFFPIGGTEVVTVPHFLKNVKSVSFMMSVYPSQVSDLYLNLAGRIRRREIDPGEATILFHEGVALRLKEKDASPSWKQPKMLLRAVSQGKKDGRRMRYSCWPSWNWMGASSALSVAALRIMRGDIRDRGVLAPEACFDPMDFFQEAALSVSRDSGKRKLLMDSFEELS